MELTLPVITTAAILDSVNPCAISVLLLSIGFLMGLGRSRKDILKLGGIYIWGIFATYILIGAGVLKALSFFGVAKGLSKAGAGVIILVGLLSLAERGVPNFPTLLSIPSFIKPKLAQFIHQATAWAMLAAGVVVGLFEFPCTGGPYLFILALLHDRSTFWPGVGYLAYYNLIFVLPLILILLAAGNRGIVSRMESFKKSKARAFDLISSILMVGLGSIILVA